MSFQGICDKIQEAIHLGKVRLNPSWNPIMHVRQPILDTDNISREIGLLFFDLIGIGHKPHLATITGIGQTSYVQPHNFGFWILREALRTNSAPTAFEAALSAFSENRGDLEIWSFLTGITVTDWASRRLADNIDLYDISDASIPLKVKWHMLQPHLIIDFATSMGLQPGLRHVFSDLHQPYVPSVVRFVQAISPIYIVNDDDIRSIVTQTCLPVQKHIDAIHNDILCSLTLSGPSDPRVISNVSMPLESSTPPGPVGHGYNVHSYHNFSPSVFAVDEGRFRATYGMSRGKLTEGRKGADVLSAIRRIARSLPEFISSHPSENNILDLSLALEILLGNSDARDSISYRVSTRFARGYRDKGDRQKAKRLCQKFYNARSIIVHGGNKSTRNNLSALEFRFIVRRLRAEALLQLCESTDHDALDIDPAGQIAYAERIEELLEMLGAEEVK